MTVTVLGDRQTGKSEMLIALAAWLIREGQRVLYVGHDMTTVTDKMRRLERNVYGDDAYTIHRAHGAEGVTHASGGQVIFASERSGRGRGFNCDALILDEVDSYPHANPYVQFVYRAPLAETSLI